MKANDRNKDQSYFLYTLSQERLSRLLFPLGKYSNAEVKQVAKERNLPVQNKPSQDLCFISGKNYRSFFVQHLSTEPGDIVDSSGETLGRHQGIAFYTIGQRRGLGTISGKPFYVIRIDSGNNQVVLGAEEELYSREAIAQKASWIAGTPPADFNGVTAKIRYRSTEVPVTVSLQEKSITIWFSQPQRAVTPGQAIVFYHGNEVLGGGIIENFLPVSPSKAAMNPVSVTRS
jgi:tRNA-specific 2-thiouridylase